MGFAQRIWTFFFQRIPRDLRAEFDDRITRENARRIVYGIAIGIVTQVVFSWMDVQRMRQGLFEQFPAYRWIFYVHSGYWLLVWVPFFFIRNWTAISSGQYPIRELRPLVWTAMVWTWAFALARAALHFQFNHALGFYNASLFITCVFILGLRARLVLMLLSMAVMSLAVFLETELTTAEIQYWLFSIVNITLLVFLVSSLWHNNISRQFLAEKSLDDQKRQLADQAELLATQNQIIEKDKSLLAEQLDGSRRQLNAFALRLAKKGNFLDDVKTDISSLDATDLAASKKRLLRKIDQESAAENDWAQFREQFEQVHPHFFRAILAQFPTLNAGELRLLSLLKMNLESKEIADILGISTQSLNTARYRLRKSLGLTGEENLTEFVHRFE